ncbi:hypothetical protein ACU36R_14555 [Pectobacterium brasiliense]|uniref:hypothetical protein n=1 Tax=Pectobacterium brasiliense TaxID=180957 RepID=UPI00406D1C3A
MKQIGVAIPTYNRLDQLTRLIDSIPENVNIGISDNGAYINELRIWKNAKIIQHTDVIPMFNNWNSAINVVDECDVLAITSDDDYYSEGAFDTVSKYIEEYDSDIYIFGCNIIDEKDNLITSYCPEKLELFMPYDGLKHHFIHIQARMPAVFFKKGFLDRIGYFDTNNFKITAADSELIQRALILGRSLYVPEVVANYRMWGGNLTNKTIASDQWLIEVARWTKKVKRMLAEVNKKECKLDWYKYEDEILALNILSGLSVLKGNKEYKKLLEHYKKHGIPNKARLITKLRIIKQVLVSKVEGLRSV